jgi:general secretion pathway protein F
MSTFRWEAVDADGRMKQGLLEADTPRSVRDQLRAGGLTPTAVDAAAARSDAFSLVRLPAPLLAMTTRQLATLTLSGMPLDQALSAVAEQADDSRAAKLAAQLREQVASGESLPSALARYPRAFSPLYRGLVGAGAETGRLAEVLARLADYLEAREALRQKVILALIYPAVVTVIAFGVIAVLLVYVVPQVVSVVPAEPADVAVADTGADRQQRLFPGDRIAVARRDRRRAGRFRGGAAARFVSRALARVPVAACPWSGACCAVSTPRASRARSPS